jgi:hypothetical protein
MKENVYIVDSDGTFHKVVPEYREQDIDAKGKLGYTFKCVKVTE